MIEVREERLAILRQAAIQEEGPVVQRCSPESVLGYSSQWRSNGIKVGARLLVSLISMCLSR